MSSENSIPRRIDGDGWLALIGGGEFSFEETEEADAAWLEKVPEDASVGFVPAASDSADYGRHFAVYLDEYFDRRSEIVPVYRQRDARRLKNARRIRDREAIYVGGGVPDHLLDALYGDDGTGSPALDALRAKIEGGSTEVAGDDPGGMVVAIAGAAQVCGHLARSLFGGQSVIGFGWLKGGVVEPNYEKGRDRRLRELLAHPGVSWGVAIPPGSAVLLGPRGEVQVVGRAWIVDVADADPETAQLVPLESRPPFDDPPED